VKSLAVILLSRVGLLTLTPVIALGVAGTILLYRRGERIDALLIGVVCAAFLLLDTAYWLPVGGASPGPRFLMPILPFLAVAMALSFERIPITTAVLGGVSIAGMTAVTITHPILAAAGGVPHRLGSRAFTDTIFSQLGFGTANVTAAAFIVLATGAIVLAVAATPRPLPSRLDMRAAASAVLGWLVTVLAAHELVKSASTQQDSRSGSLAALAVAAAVSAAVVWLHKRASVPGASSRTVDGRRAAKEATVEPNAPLSGTLGKKP
jgi:hypothetical protein